MDEKLLAPYQNAGHDVLNAARRLEFNAKATSKTKRNLSFVAKSLSALEVDEYNATYTAEIRNHIELHSIDVLKDRAAEIEAEHVKIVCCLITDEIPIDVEVGDGLHDVWEQLDEQSQLRFCHLLADGELTETEQKPNEPNEQEKFDDDLEIKNFIDKLKANQPIKRGDQSCLAREITGESKGKDPKAQRLVNRYRSAVNRGHLKDYR